MRIWVEKNGNEWPSWRSRSVICLVVSLSQKRGGAQRKPTEENLECRSSVVTQHYFSSALS